MRYIAIGKITKPHGLQGYVKVIAYSGIPVRFLDLKSIYIESDDGTQGFIIDAVRLQNRTTVLKLRGIDTRESARLLTGKEMVVPEAQKIELAEDTYFIHDLVGLKVFDETETYLGEVTDVWQSSGNDIYVVRNEKREILIPAVSEFIKHIDVDQKRMTVQLIEGMIE